MTGPSVRSGSGSVSALHRKPETPGERGLPKRSVPSVVVRRDGVEGDFNRWRQETRNGDRDLAILIHTEETLADLRAEGWPVMPGDLGENILTRGVPYDAFVPPARFRFGSVLVETVKPCDPCDNLHLLPYVGPSKGAAFVRTMIGRRGWYGRVIDEGEIRVGDAVHRVA